MPITQQFKVEEKEATEFKPLPKGIYQVEIIDIEGDYRPTYDTKNKPEAEQIKELVLNFTFGVVSQGEFRGRRIWRNFVPNYLYIGKNGKNLLYQITEAVLRRELSPEDRATLDQEKLNKLIGYQLVLVVEMEMKGEKTFNNIKAFMPIQQSMTKLTEEEKTVKKDEKADPSNPQNVQIPPATPEMNAQASQTREITLDMIPF